MARYIGPKLKISRRFGVKLGLRTNEEVLTKKPYKPGPHGPKGRRGRVSEYGLQLMEKQKAKFIYGILEKQFRNYYKKASAKSQNVGLAMLQLLETRLDSVVYKGGYALTQNQARQFVNHGHVKVDGKKVTIPSFQVLPGMKISLSSDLVQKIEDERGHTVDLPIWMKAGAKDVEVLAIPERDQINTIINEQLVVEFYSR